jgi:hypothetical protein
MWIFYWERYRENVVVFVSAFVTAVQRPSVHPPVRAGGCPKGLTQSSGWTCLLLSGEVDLRVREKLVSQWNESDWMIGLLEDSWCKMADQSVRH